MTKAKWTRVAALCALLALAVHGVAALGHHHARGDRHGIELTQDCVLCLLLVALFLQPDPPAGDLPVPALAGFVAAEPGPPAVAAPPLLHPSRGPPA